MIDWTKVHFRGAKAFAVQIATPGQENRSGDPTPEMRSRERAQDRTVPARRAAVSVRAVVAEPEA